MQQVYRIAFIGTQSHAGYVFDELNDCPGVKCVAVAQESQYDDIDKWKATYSPLENAKVYNDWQRMLREEKPDIVVVGRQIRFLNGIVALEALRCNCHIICEKPLASDLATLQNIKKELSARKCLLTTMLAMRCLAGFSDDKKRPYMTVS